MIPIAIGALLGAYLLLHGCILLQRRPRSSSSRVPRLTTLATPNTVLFATEKGRPAASVPEIVRLSPDRALHDAKSMTQQEKIAAALLKAGVLSYGPRRGAEDESRVAGDLADQQDVARQAPGSLVQSLDLNASQLLMKAADESRPSNQGPINQPFRWAPALMVWTGPILTLACLYILALHFGWL
jgi:hypothetical protein